MPAEQLIECTYVFKLNLNIDDDGTELTRELLQQYLGPAHEVLSASSVTLNSSHTDNPSVTHQIVKVKTTAPSEIANILMGERWVRKDHILFTAVDHGS
jgi:hypothetical protein